WSQCASCSSCHHPSETLASEFQVRPGRRMRLLRDAVKQHQLRGGDAEEYPVLGPLVSTANLVQPTAQPVDQRLAHRPVPLDGQDVAANGLGNLLAQAAKPVT